MVSSLTLMKHAGHAAVLDSALLNTSQVFLFLVNPRARTLSLVTVANPNPPLKATERTNNDVHTESLKVPSSDTMLFHPLIATDLFYCAVLLLLHL